MIGHMYKTPQQIELLLQDKKLLKHFKECIYMYPDILCKGILQNMTKLLKRSKKFQQTFLQDEDLTFFLRLFLLRGSALEQLYAMISLKTIISESHGIIKHVDGSLLLQFMFAAFHKKESPFNYLIDTLHEMVVIICAVEGSTVPQLGMLLQEIAIEQNRSPTNARTYYKNRGNACFKHHKYSKAIEWYTLSLKNLILGVNHPDSANPKVQARAIVLHNRVLCYKKIGKFKDALSDATECLYTDNEYLKGRILHCQILNHLDMKYALSCSIIQLGTDQDVRSKALTKFQVVKEVIEESFDGSDKNCHVCGKETSKKCSGCDKIRYC